MSTNKVTEHDDKLLWTINYIAEQLAVDRKTISRLIAKGNSRWYKLGGVGVCQNRQFWTGSRAKHDIIWGAWGQCNLHREKAHATL